jgi:VanZ family protein
MESQQRPKWKIILFLCPVLLWMMFIFILSSQTYAKQDMKPWIQSEFSLKQVQHYFSNTQLNYAGHMISIHMLGAAGFIEFFIRKFAHVSEYAVLGILVYQLLRIAFPNLRGCFLIMMGLCFLYAATDEFHQSFISDRTPLVVDVLLDTWGAIIGTSLYLFMIKGIPYMYRKLAAKI